MSYEQFNYASLMAVVQATQFDEEGAFIPGELMPSGRPVRAVGADRTFLMNKDMVAEWASAVKGIYEREIGEKNQEGSEEDVPSVHSDREAAPAAEHGADAPRPAPAHATVEEELEARKADIEHRLERERWERDRYAGLVHAAEVELRIITAAIAAMREARNNAEQPAKKKRGRPKIHREVG